MLDCHIQTTFLKGYVLFSSNIFFGLMYYKIGKQLPIVIHKNPFH